MESVKTRHPQLLYESKLYKLLQGGTGIPHVRHVCVIFTLLLLHYCHFIKYHCCVPIALTASDKLYSLGQKNEASAFFACNFQTFRPNVIIFGKRK